MKIAVVGAGPAGALVAGLLQQNENTTVVVYEKRSDPRKTDPSLRKFIGLLLTARGEKQISQVGITLEELKQYTSFLDGRFIHNKDGTRTLIQWGSGVGSTCRSIDRRSFVSSLINKAEEIGATFNFNTSITSVDVTKGTIQLESSSESHQFDLIIGSDGVHSVVRGGGFNHTIDVTNSSYCWLVVKKGSHDTSKINVWPHTYGIAHGTPSKNSDEINVTFILRKDLMDSFKGNPDKTRDYMKEHASRFLAVDDSIPEQIASAECGVFRTVTSDMISSKGNAVIIGDAAHAMSPYLGQGMNISLEDASVLSSCLRDSSNDIPGALQKFSLLRTPEYKACHSLVDLQQKYFTKYIREYLTSFRMKYHSIMRWIAPIAYCPPLREMVNSPGYTFAEAEVMLTKQNQSWCIGRVYE